MPKLPNWVVRDLRRQELEARLRAAASSIPSHSFRPSNADANACFTCGMAKIMPIHDLQEVDDWTYDETVPSPDQVDETQISAEEHSGMMIALFPDPDQAKRLSVKGGEKAKNLHVTLAYFPQNGETDDFEKLSSLLQGVVETLPPLEGEISGMGVFSTSKNEGRVTYASVDIPGLPAFRQHIIDLCSRAGFTISGDHGFSPHMTLAYGDDRKIDPPNEELAFDEIVLCQGKVRKTFKLGGAEKAADGKTVNSDSKHAYSHPHYINGAGVPNKNTPPCLVCGKAPTDKIHSQPSMPAFDPSQVAAALQGPEVMKVIAGIDAGIDQALVLLRSCNNDVMPEYAQQARDLLQGVDVSMDQLMEFFDIPDPDKSDTDDVDKTQKSDGPDSAGPVESTIPHVVPAGPIESQPQHPDANTMPVIGQKPATLMQPVITELQSPVSTLEHVLGQPGSNGVTETIVKETAFVTELNGRTILTAPASTLVQQWEKAATPNKHLLWMQGRFVGAEKANRNNAFWTTGDLEMGQPTVAYGPLNWLHEAKHVIGCIADSKLVMPDGQQVAAVGGSVQPHISALSAVWTWIYPDEAWVIENASDQGRLWYSMECVSKQVECVGDGGCGEKASYGDYMGGRGCQHMRQRSATRRFEDPTFLGGAVIVPPVRPGWADADAQVMRQAAAMAEKAYEDAGKPDVPASVWEQMMAGVVTYAES